MNEELGQLELGLIEGDKLKELVSAKSCSVRITSKTGSKPSRQFASLDFGHILYDYLLLQHNLVAEISCMNPNQTSCNSRD